MSFLVTPSDHENGDLCSRKTTEFLKEFGAQIAINGNGFGYVLNSSGRSDGHDLVRVNGFAASRGKVYSDRGGPTVYINRNKVLRIDELQGKPFNAVSGDRVIIKKGKQVPNLATNIPNPRTALGLTKNRPDPDGRGRTPAWLQRGRQTSPTWCS